MPDAGVMFAKVTAFPAAVSPCDLLAAERADLLAGRRCDGAVCHLRDPLRAHLAVPGLAWPTVAVVAAAPAADAVATSPYALRQRAEVQPWCQAAGRRDRLPF